MTDLGSVLGLNDSIDLPLGLVGGGEVLMAVSDRLRGFVAALTPDHADLLVTLPGVALV